jgi:maltokinase
VAASLSPLERIARELTPERLSRERWFAGKGRAVAGTRLAGGLDLGGGGTLALIDVEYEDGEGERYAVPGGDRLWESILQGAPLAAQNGRFVLHGSSPARGVARPLGVDQSNSSFVLGEALLVKCYRLLWPGVHPEVELIAHLGGRVASVPRAAGSLHYVDEQGRDWAVALFQEYVPDAEDGWAVARRLVEAGEPGLELAAGVGSVTADLHAALAALGSRAASPDELERRRAEAGSQLEQAGAPLRDPDRVRQQLARFLDAGGPVVTRVHGDYHVGQILRSPAGLHVVDFEGEPTRPPDRRREPDSPLRDVASILRSFDHVPLWVLRDRPDGGPAARRWSDTCRAAFLSSYGPVDHGLLRAYEAHKAVYELSYAASFLPEWTPIALEGLELLLAREVGE